MTYEMANPKTLPSTGIMISHQMRVEATFNTFNPTPSSRTASTTPTTIFNAVLLTTLPLDQSPPITLGQAEELPGFVVAGSRVAVTARHHPADVSQKFAA